MEADAASLTTVMDSTSLGMMYTQFELGHIMPSMMISTLL